MIVKELESVQVILAEESLVLHVLYDVLLEHLLADHEDFLLVGRYSLSKPVEDLLAAAALRVLAEPTIFVVEHLDVFVHDVGPFFEICQMVVFNLHGLVLFYPAMILDDFGLLVLAEALIRVSILLRGDQVDDLEDLVLDVVLIDKGQYLILDGREVSHLED